MRIGIAGLSGMSIFMACDHFHAPGETITANAIRHEPGGKAYNQALAAQRLGAQVVFASACGDDEDGRVCRETLARQGVSAFWQHSDKHTALAHILTDRRGQNRVTVFHGAADALNAGFIRLHEDAWQSCDAFLLGLECPMEALQELVRVAREHGIPVTLNPAPARRLAPGFFRQFQLLTPNEQEAAEILGLPAADHAPETLAREFFRQGYERAVVTLGRRGALALEQGRAWLYPAIPAKAVDTTGAGDCFNAALVVALARGETLHKAMEYAVNASACSVLHPGVVAAMPTAGEVASRWVAVPPTELF